MPLSSTRLIAATLAATLAGPSVSLALADSVTPNVGVAKFRFLEGSQWYVPAATLPAVELNLKTGATRALVDQTVWDITGYRYGYFWGRTAAVFTRPATGAPISAPSCARMVGSVTPSGRVHITFVGQNQNTTLGAVRGTGTLSRGDQQEWLFEMQMSTGTTSVIAHWSYMAQCKSGQPCEAQLPGSELSLAEFLAQCD